MKGRELLVAQVYKVCIDGRHWTRTRYQESHENKNLLKASRFNTVRDLRDDTDHPPVCSHAHSHRTSEEVNASTGSRRSIAIVIRALSQVGL